MKRKRLLRKIIKKLKKANKSVVLILGIAAALLFALSLLLYIKGRNEQKVETGKCEFHFVDVGQGDCSLFLTENGSAVIDAGPRGTSRKTAAYIAYRTGKIDYMILTHPDEDHIGGAVDIINAVNVENIIMTDAVKDTYSFSSLLSAIEKRKINLIKAEAGNIYHAGEITLTLLAPLEKTEDYNDYSIVTRVQYGKTSAIVTGDAQTLSEHLMIEKYAEKLKTDVLKLAHHGSSTSTGIDFLELTSPDYAVISCGKDNEYGHPHREILELLSDFGIKYYRTDKNGDIVFISDGKNIQHK